MPPQKSSIKHTIDRSSFFLLLALTLFLLGTLTKTAIPLAEWDYVSVDAARNWAHGINKEWLFDHPPLYPFFLTILFKFLGSSIVVARIGNTICCLVTGLFLFRTANLLFDRDAAIWAATSYFVSPVCIQGVLSMDVADTSLLPLVFAFTIHSIVANTLSPHFRNTAMLALGVGLCFWAKVTSSIVLITGFCAGILLMIVLERKRAHKSWLLNLLGVVVGLLGFLVSWITISSLLWGKESCMAVFLTPWTALFSRTVVLDHSFNFLQSVRHVIVILVWFSPYFIFQWLYSSWMIAGKHRRGSDKDSLILLLIGFNLFYFIGYALIGGTNWGFPRYHDAILPSLCLFSGFFFSRFVGELDGKAFRVFGMGLLFSVVFLIFFTQDPLYFLNLRLKEMLFSNDDIRTLTKHAFMIFLPLYGLPIAIGVIAALYSPRSYPHRIFITCLLVGSLATMISLDIQQLLASYRTSTEYGASGRDEVVETVQKQVRSGDCVLATPQFTYELRDQEIRSGGWQVWESPERFREFVIAQKPSAIIAGLTVNTYDQMKWLLSKDMKASLAEEYSLKRIGTYFLWLKKAPIQKPTELGSHPENYLCCTYRDCCLGRDIL